MQITISKGTVAIINPFRDCMLVPTNSPHKENMIEESATPIKDNIIFEQFADNLKTSPTKVPIVIKGITFATMYSEIFTGDTPKEDSTLWLFSNNTIAPIKKSPIAAGSVNIRILATIGFAEPGIKVSNAM